MENPEHFEREIANRKLFRPASHFVAGAVETASKKKASVHALQSWQFLLGTF
jgi:hypothetical protein